ncbi:MAG: hypothetical protein H8E41_12755 [Desulfobulbaceae bacterium]|uniref:Cytoplasmic protein n=1 Tax=Candidatus Desulfobia pelagia TaxID=2841692 RepID=A0A8J6NHH8_9BACT|nr:hypothetical protein [Candidatus Desulfobia pelagia]
MKNDDSVTDINVQGICFGMDRETDERSLAAFLQIFSSPVLLETLIPRLSEAEIAEILDFVSRVMHTHLSEKEYHALFLKR